jgi:large subunit ribosomal protein L24
VALSLDDDKNVDGEIGLDALALAPAFALAIGAAGHDAAEPLNAGLTKGWRGRVAFQALRGSLPGGGELRPVSGTITSDGQSLTFEDIKGKIGGGEAIVNVDARQSASGIALNARAQFSGVDGGALRYRALAMPAGRVSMQATLASQGRSASALIGALSGSGAVMLESAKVAGLDPRAFEVGIRASDNGQATDDTKLRQIVEPALSAGALSVASAQIPFTIRDGRMRIGPTTFDVPGVRAVVSGGYDIPADQADIRAALALTMPLPVTGRPEIQLFAVGTPDALSRTVDVAGLSSWLAVRAIEHETRRLDAIERGEPPPPPMPAPVSLPPQEDTQPSGVPPGAGPPSEPLSQVPLPGRDPRRSAPKAKAVAPRPPAAPPIVNAPAAVVPTPNAPVVSQQVAPLPPAIDVKPAPGAVKPKPRPAPPLVLTPPAAAPAR